MINIQANSVEENLAAPIKEATTAPTAGGTKCFSLDHKCKSVGEFSQCSGCLFPYCPKCIKDTAHDCAGMTTGNVYGK